MSHPDETLNDKSANYAHVDNVKKPLCFGAFLSEVVRVGNTLPPYPVDIPIFKALSAFFVFYRDRMRLKNDRFFKINTRDDS